MNLRTHTYTIPALSGLVAFMLLVVADFSFRRATQGDDYGFAAYVTDVNHRGLPADAAPAGPAAVVGRAAPTLAAAGPTAPTLDAPALAGPAAPPLAMRAALAVPSAVAVPLRLLSAVSLPDVPAEQVALAEVSAAPAEEPGSATLASDTPPAARASCSSDQGFKRCRIGQ